MDSTPTCLVCKTNQSSFESYKKKLFKVIFANEIEIQAINQPWITNKATNKAWKGDHENVGHNQDM